MGVVCNEEAGGYGSASGKNLRYEMASAATVATNKSSQSATAHVVAMLQANSTGKVQKAYHAQGSPPGTIEPR